MSSFEWNKIIGAVLGSMILAMVSGIIAGNLVKSKRLEHPVYTVAGGEPTTPAAPGAAQAGPEPLEPLLATADPAAGKDKAKVCAACHTFDKGGKNGVGPNLYNIVGEPVAGARSGYNGFSAALQAHGKETWTVDGLNKWLYDPKSYASGTKMSFPGFKNARDRANVIAFLNTLSDAPKPFGK